MAPKRSQQAAGAKPDGGGKKQKRAPPETLAEYREATGKPEASKRAFNVLKKRQNDRRKAEEKKQRMAAAEAELLAQGKTVTKLKRATRIGTGVRGQHPATTLEEYQADGRPGATLADFNCVKYQREWKQQKAAKEPVYKLAESARVREAYHELTDEQLEAKEACAKKYREEYKVEISAEQKAVRHEPSQRGTNKRMREYFHTLRKQLALSHLTSQQQERQLKRLMTAYHAKNLAFTTSNGGKYEDYFDLTGAAKMVLEPDTAAVAAGILANKSIYLDSRCEQRSYEATLEYVNGGGGDDEYSRYLTGTELMFGKMIRFLPDDRQVAAIKGIPHLTTLTGFEYLAPPLNPIPRLPAATSSSQAQPASTGSADQTSDARVSFPLKRSPPIAKQAAARAGAENVDPFCKVKLNAAPPAAKEENSQEAAMNALLDGERNAALQMAAVASASHADATKSAERRAAGDNVLGQYTRGAAWSSSLDMSAGMGAAEGGQPMVGDDSMKFADAWGAKQDEDDLFADSDEEAEVADELAEWEGDFNARSIDALAADAADAPPADGAYVDTSSGSAPGRIRRYQPDMAKLHSNGMLVIEEVKSFPGTMYLSACSGVIIPKIQATLWADTRIAGAAAAKGSGPTVAAAAVVGWSSCGIPVVVKAEKLVEYGPVIIREYLAGCDVTGTRPIDSAGLLVPGRHSLSPSPHGLLGRSGYVERGYTWPREHWKSLLQQRCKALDVESAA